MCPFARPIQHEFLVNPECYHNILWDRIVDRIFSIRTTRVRIPNIKGRFTRKNKFKKRVFDDLKIEKKSRRIQCLQQDRRRFPVSRLGKHKQKSKVWTRPQESIYSRSMARESKTSIWKVPGSHGRMKQGEDSASNGLRRFELSVTRSNHRWIVFPPQHPMRLSAQNNSRVNKGCLCVSINSNRSQPTRSNGSRTPLLLNMPRHWLLRDAELHSHHSRASHHTTFG